MKVTMTTGKLKSAALAWLVLNLFLIPALAEMHGVVPESAYQTLQHSSETVGAFGAVTPVFSGEAQPMQLVSNANTVSYSGGSIWAYILYGIILIGFWALIVMAPANAFAGYGLTKSVFVIGLMIAIPVFSARVFGSGINEISIIGSSGIPNYVTQADTITVRVNVTITGDDNITKDQVALQFGPETAFFDQCNGGNVTLGCLPTSQNDTAICECINMLGSANNPLINARNPMQFMVFTDNNKITPMAYTLRYIYMDQQPPVFISKTIFQRGPKAQINFTVKDNAVYVEGDVTRCAGLDRIDFYANGVLLSGDSVDLEQEPDNCTTVTKNHNLSISQSGQTNVTLSVRDNLGNVRNETVNISLDFEPPFIDSTFKVFQAGREIEYISTSGPTAGLRLTKIEIKITEENLAMVYADLSDLNDNILYKERYSQAQMTACQKEDDVYTCLFTKSAIPNPKNEDIFIRTQDNNLHINITAIDSVGLNSTKTVTTTMTVDNDKGQVTKLGTYACTAEKCFVKKGSNLFRAQITDPGSGFDHSLVYLDTYPLTGISNSSQMWCDGNGSDWGCLISGVVLEKQEGHSYRIGINYLSMDDAGNTLAGETEALVEYDNTAPAIDKNRSMVLSVLTDATLVPYHVSGDTLHIVLFGTDTGSGLVDENGNWDVAVNLQDVITDPAGNATWTQADLCQQEKNGSYMCVWEQGPINDGPVYLTEGIPVRIRDLVGNENRSFSFAPFIIYDIATSSPGDVWSIIGSECMPPFVDRAVTKYFPGGNRIWCEFILKADSKYVALDVQPYGPCVPDNETVDSFQSSSLFGNQILTGEGVPSPIGLFSIFSFDQEVIPDNISLFTFICPYQVTFADSSRNRLTVFVPELVNHTVALEVKSGDDADMASATAEQVGEMRARLEDMSWLSTVNDIVDAFKKICRMVYALVNGCSAFMQILGSGIFEALPPPYKMALGISGEACSIAKGGVFDAFMQFCDYATCRKNWLEELAGENAFSDVIEAWMGLTGGQIPGIDGPDGTAHPWNELMESEFATADVYDNMIFSVLTMCIPGILYNLEKARQIDCYYVMCMEKMVALGVPVYVCDTSRFYMYCRIVVGQLFNVFPFATMIKQLSSRVLELVTDPMAVAGFIQGLGCGTSWLGGWLTTAWICEYPPAAMQIAATVDSLSTQIKTFSSQQDFCAMAEI